MYVVILILSCIAGVLLIGAVLIQPGKGDLAAGMGGFGGQFGTMIGMRRAADFIIKTTIYLAITIMLLALSTHTIFSPDSQSQNAPMMQGQEIPDLPAPVNVNVPSNPAQTAPAQAAPAQPVPAPATQGQAAPTQKPQLKISQPANKVAPNTEAPKTEAPKTEAPPETKPDTETKPN
jgi:protein translocase SecG subunit